MARGTGGGARRHRPVTDRTQRLLVGVAVVALLGAGFLGYLTVRDRGGTASAAPTAAHPPSAAPAAFHSRRGGFSLRVPEGMRVHRTGSSVRLDSDDGQLVVTVGPAGRGRLPAVAATLLDRIRGTYHRVRVLGHRQDRVDGRPARTTYGRATNADGVRLRFVVVLVRAEPADYAITAFTRLHSDPAEVLPQVNTVANTLRLSG